YKHVSANQPACTQGNKTNSVVPPSCIPVPTGNVPVPNGSLPVSTGSILVLAAATMPTTRFPSPSDLGNHNPSPGIFTSSSYDDEFNTALNNVASSVEVSPMPTKRINTIHPQSLIIGDPTSAVQTSVARALKDPSWVDAMQEEMQQFKFQNVWVLVDLPPSKYAIGTKWILKNKRDARGIVVCKKARLVAQGHRQEEGINYDEVFTPVDRIEAIRLFLAFASYIGFLVYQMDVKSSFLYERIKEEVYVTQPKGLQVQQTPDGIFLHQVKYVHEILNKFDFRNVKTATTPYEAPKPKSKSESDSPVNVHLYRSMIGSLMYLTASRPNIMFAVSAYSRHQVAPTTSNLEAVK
nr:ribonuclease H-like domain, reverse transcriptase, RNA-dependent DNA polymerase [Tanacetum cinerariifolium]